jgi:polyhydroxyalkanoate synthesis regulator phasin
MAKTPLDRLANLGEEVLGKAAQNPSLSRFVQSAAQLRDRVDDLTKRVRGLEAMERRIDELEQRVATLETPPKKTTAKKESP